jgi:NADH dehydrogenase (ubiquinone) 1 alpha subcomplex subunit 8
MSKTKEEEEDKEESRAPTSSVLFASHKHLQKRCAQQTAQYLSCKRGNQDPEECLKEGAKVTGCMLDVLKDLRAKCPETMNEYAACLDYRSNQFEKCRKEQQKFENECPL